MALTETETPSGHAKVNENGRILIPAAVRERMGIKLGDSVVWKLEDGILHVESYQTRIHRIQEEFKAYRSSGKLASEELIAERREEARREMEEALGQSHSG
jgi:AbrB family looped-hinge helix DNA binding protein